MELNHPAVDDRVLAFLQGYPFRADDFARSWDRSCRLHPQVARAVVAAWGLARERVADHAVWLRTLLLSWV